MNRYFNITTVDEQAGASHTQVMVSSFDNALESLNVRVARMSKHEAPMIRAFIFDTQLRELRCYSIRQRVVTEVKLYCGDCEDI